MAEAAARTAVAGVQWPACRQLVNRQLVNPLTDSSSTDDLSTRSLVACRPVQRQLSVSNTIKGKWFYAWQGGEWLFIEPTGR